MLFSQDYKFSRKCPLVSLAVFLLFSLRSLSAAAHGLQSGQELLFPALGIIWDGMNWICAGWLWALVFFFAFLPQFFPVAHSPLILVFPRSINIGNAPVVWWPERPRSSCCCGVQRIWFREQRSVDRNSSSRCAPRSKGMSPSLNSFPAPKWKIKSAFL